MEHLDERVKALQKRSLQVLPLKYRRETPQKLLPVEALCEFDTDDVSSVFCNVHMDVLSPADRLLLCDTCRVRLCAVSATLCSGTTAPNGM